jgi:hypothetical protein
MADKFDPYREANVVETSTVWGPEFDDLEPAEKRRIAAALHAAPAEAGKLEYVRVHTGFCRQITVTEADVSRVAQ